MYSWNIWYYNNNRLNSNAYKVLFEMQGALLSETFCIICHVIESTVLASFVLSFFYSVLGKLRNNQYKCWMCVELVFSWTPCDYWTSFCKRLGWRRANVSSLLQIACYSIFKIWRSFSGWLLSIVWLQLINYNYPKQSHK